jgi:tripartite-type tricarboxylate transporter receptor subunit TctC
MTDLMGGQVPMLFSSLGPAVGAVKGGKIRPIAVTSLHRSAAFPDVPTMDELGRASELSFLRGFDSTAWYGILGPAGLPQEVIAKWTQVLARAGADKAVMNQISATGCDAEILTPAQTAARVATDHAKWGRVVKEANIRAD